MAGYQVWHPMLGKENLRNEVEFRAKDYRHPVSTNHAIFGRDQWMVQQCDIILADLLDSTRVSIGTMYELAWASILGKHTLVIMDEDNLHQHSFVLESADIVFSAVKEAIAYLLDLQGKPPSWRPSQPASCWLRIEGANE
jgi:nucleoside 2-deoxyribosyltransferase